MLVNQLGFFELVYILWLYWLNKWLALGNPSQKEQRWISCFPPFGHAPDQAFEPSCKASAMPRIKDEKWEGQKEKLKS